ncbi:IS1595 family transposase [Roseomonas terrae]|uniref:IS1595 family transposase n=1 Tax=Neoroseomonas terrae TaxID=424799 RepID=A0ABS5EDD1_9PROT|nr:IS1595 family transposase [Neoroseomonas terrae]MBR0649020.1 IS1595 family transposase [Neoroseomonas terrae]
MATDLTAPIYTDEAAARAHLERLRWPNGPVCPHCGVIGEATRLAGEAHRPGLLECRACRRQFSVTVGTVFERSHVPLNKWVLATHLMSASKKGISAHQLHRMLGVTYKTAWFMAHRIREAMTDQNPGPIGGEGKVIEADEAYLGKVETPVPSSSRKGRPYLKRDISKQKRPIVALVERGGEVRAMHMPVVTGENIRDALVRNADRASRLHTDESRLYPKVGAEFAAHETVQHSAGEYARGDVTTNSVEGFFGILKRGMRGVYQHCGEQHFQRYINEFAFRYNNRVRLGVDDNARARLVLLGITGKRLTYRRIGVA